MNSKCLEIFFFTKFILILIPPGRHFYHHFNDEKIKTTTKFSTFSSADVSGAETAQWRVCPEALPPSPPPRKCPLREPQSHPVPAWPGGSGKTPARAEPLASSWGLHSQPAIHPRLPHWQQPLLSPTVHHALCPALRTCREQRQSQS